MKHFILMIPLIFIASIVIARENNTNKPDFMERMGGNKQEHYSHNSSRNLLPFEREQTIPDFETLKQNGLLKRDGDFYLYQALFQDWDGNDWVNSGQVTYTYDADGNLLSYLSQDWDGNDWVNSGQVTYTYDADGNLLSYLSQDWGGSDWVNSGQVTYTYDADGNLLSLLFQDWDGSDWVNSSQGTYTYDADGNQLSLLWQDWDGNDWVNYGQYTYTYDADGNQLSLLYQVWDGNDWVNDYQYTYTYDTDGNLLSWLFQDWDGYDWVNSGQATYTYDTDGNKLSLLRQDWDGSDWVNDYQSTYTYDTDGNLLSWLYQDWDGYDWVNSSQYTYTYDTDGNQLSLLSQTWDGYDWVNDWQDTYTYLTGAPMIVDVVNQSMDEDSSLTININVNSVFNTTFTYYAISDSNTVSISLNSNLITLNPTENWSGSSIITVIVIDANSLSDTTSFLLTVNPVNDTPELFNVLYPTVTDTFSSHIDSNQDIVFTWSNCHDVDNDVEYSLTIFMEFFGNYYYDVYDNITDTTISISGNNLDDLLGGLNISETSLNWYVNANDADYSVSSDTGEFVLSRSLLDVLEDLSIPTAFTLHQNYPNPFNPTTTLRYDLPENVSVEIMIFDIMGREIKMLVNNQQNAGYKSVVWDATNELGQPVSAGMYLYRISTGEFHSVKKMVLLK